MRRYSVLLAGALLLLLALVPRLRALTDEQLKEQFLESRGSSGISPSPSPSPHHHRHAEAEPTPHHHRHSPTPEPEAAEHHHHAATPEPEETPRHHDAVEPERTPHPRVTPEPDRTPAHEERSGLTQPFQQTVPTNTQPLLNSPPPQFPPPMPRATAAPTPAPGPVGTTVDIEKEGLEEEGGLVPPPEPSIRRHWWQFFGGEDRTDYRFLTRAIREAIDRAPVARRRWRFIVVHNSGTRQGNARIFDYYHRYVRKMPNGLAYHFVIGNGTSSGNGQIEIGGRWTKQLQGGHVHSDYLNNISLGICLVGDFNRDLPTKDQLVALKELIDYLRIRVGKIDHKPAIVKAHREINPPQWPTDCPGDRFPYHWLHQTFG
ncbi:MAG TPA: N-acetylmuramoyl-L-alanine amidase [Chthoniobacteraceae bacterium]|nr:N-acetylmuramoyl-L-alanine amidase [Chthoniobacteraceae bacterium]